jgi:hypothetical protein
MKTLSDDETFAEPCQNDKSAGIEEEENPKMTNKKH